MKGIVLLLALAGGLLPGLQDPGKPLPTTPELKIKKDKLKSTLVELGYEPKELGNGVLEIQVDRSGEAVFIAVSMSASLSKIWLTGNFGVLTEREKSDPAFLLSLLEKNGEILPVHFYVRKGKLNIGIPVDNRVATPTVLNKEIGAFADSVVKTKAFWERKE